MLGLKGMLVIFVFSVEPIGFSWVRNRSAMTFLNHLLAGSWPFSSCQCCIMKYGGISKGSGNSLYVPAAG